MKRPNSGACTIRRLVAGWFVFAVALLVCTAVTVAQPKRRLSPTRIIELPQPNTTGAVSLEEALLKLQPVRRFAPEALKSDQISQLAWAALGSQRRRAGLKAPPVPEAALPMELYVATSRGLFRYDPAEHSLQQLSRTDPRPRLAKAVPDGRPITDAGCDFIIVGSSKTFAAYGKHATRLMHLQAGHAAQNVRLQAAALDLGSVAVGAFEPGPVSRLCKLSRNQEPVCIICVGQSTDEAEQEQTVAGRAVLIVPSRDFRDEELFETMRILEASSVQTVIASSRIGLITGTLGGAAEATVPLGQIRVENFDAVIFIGGLGAREYFASPAALHIARTAVEQRKILAAMSIAPSILANAGVLKGVRATAWASERDVLVLSGAAYTGSLVERDGLIITGRDPMAAPLFAQAIAGALRGR
jgi:protease I